MSVQLSIDAYFKTKSASSLNRNKKQKVMKRHSLSLIKPLTPVKSMKIDDDITIMEKVVPIVDLLSDDENLANITEPVINSQASISNSTSNPMTTTQLNLTPSSEEEFELTPKKLPIKYSKGVSVTTVDLPSDNDIAPSTQIEQSTATNKGIRCRSLNSIINELNSNLSQQQSTDVPTNSSTKPNNLPTTPQKENDLSNSSLLNDAGSSNSSTSTILYTLSPCYLQTPQKSQINHNFTSPSSSSKKYYSPNKKRAVKRSPAKKKLALDFSSTSNEDEVFTQACEDMDDKTKFLLSIVNKCINDKAYTSLLDQASLSLLNKVLYVKKPGARVVCRLFWRQHRWYRVDQMKQLSSEKNKDVDDTNFGEIMNILVESNFISSSNGNDIMTFEDYAQVLKGDEVKQICKDLKIKHQSKQDAVQSLRSFSKKNSISTYFTGNPSNNTKRVLDIMKIKTGPCYKLSDTTREALNKLYVLMYLGMNYETIRSKKLELMLINEKNNIETYPVDKSMVDGPNVIFNNNDEFSKYYDAHVIYENYLSEDSTQEKCKIINNVLKLYYEIPEDDMLRYKSRPVWLHRFTPPYLYLKLLEAGIQELKKDKQRELALDVVTCLIAQLAFRQHKKAEWYAEKGLILHKLYGFHNEAAEILAEGLKSDLPFQSKDVIRRRADLLAKLQNIELDERLKKELEEYASKELILENKFKADHISKQHIESNNQRGKKKFKIETENETKYVDAEDYCVIHYLNEGPWTHAQHWEGRIVTTIFFLLFWDIIYSKPRGVCGVFLSPYQVFPLDMYCASFYRNRKGRVDERLAAVGAMQAAALLAELQAAWERRPEHELSGINRSVGWENVRAVGECLGARRVAALCRRLAADPGYFHSGFPDLTLWNIHTKQIKFVEVKTDTDKPSIKQLQWMQYLSENGMDTGFCYLGAHTTRCRARARDS